MTEAGDGEDGRIKSAIGIGSLLSDGIGDTIRVSLTEDSVHEIPVARALVDLIGRKAGPTPESAEPWSTRSTSFDPFSYERRETTRLDWPGAALGGEEPVRVAVRPETHAQLAHKLDRLGDYRPEVVVAPGSIAWPSTRATTAPSPRSMPPTRDWLRWRMDSTSRSSPPFACSPRASRRGTRFC